MGVELFLRQSFANLLNNSKGSQKVKQSRYTMKALVGRGIKLLLFLGLGSRWG
jgi:hypothetical protein